MIVDCTILELVLCLTLCLLPKKMPEKSFHFVLRLSFLRKFNMRKLRGPRNGSQNLIWLFFFFFFLRRFWWIIRGLGILFHNYDWFDCWPYYFRTCFVCFSLFGPQKMRKKVSMLCWYCRVWEKLTWGN